MSLLPMSKANVPDDMLKFLVHARRALGLTGHSNF